MKKVTKIMIIVDFVKKNNESDKVRDHCHLTGKNRGPAHNACNINETQKQSNFIPLMFHNFSNYDCHLFFGKLVDKRKSENKNLKLYLRQMKNIFQ